MASNRVHNKVNHAEVPLEDKQSVLVSVKEPRSDMGAYTYFKIRYDESKGLLIERLTDASRRHLCVDVASKSIFFWVQAVYAFDRRLQFSWAQVWAYTMVMLQLTAFLLIMFEPPGMVDDNDVMRYISDNIDRHCGMGAVMVLAFGGSYLLIAAISIPGNILPVMRNILIMASAFGGAGVVLFHGEHSTEHIVCAAIFIGAGLLLHLIIICTGPMMFIHRARDALIATVAVVSALVFLGTLIYCREKVKKENLEPRDPRLMTGWWVSGICEYMLYINCCVLNAFVGQRLSEHTCFSIFQALPELCRQHG
eukprot:3359386-Rhodomonas_salina.1